MGVRPVQHCASLAYTAERASKATDHDLPNLQQQRVLGPQQALGTVAEFQAGTRPSAANGEAIMNISVDRFGKDHWSTFAYWDGGMNTPWENMPEHRLPKRATWWQRLLGRENEWWRALRGGTTGTMKVGKRKGRPRSQPVPQTYSN